MSPPPISLVQTDTGAHAPNSSAYRNRVFNEDCVQGMATHLPDACCDLIITDPPFAIDFTAKRSNYNRTASRVLEGYREVNSHDYQEFSRAWIAQARRVLKPSGSLFVFSGWNNLKDILVAADEAGLQQVNHIIWKYQFGVATRRRFVTSHYHCLFYCVDDGQRVFHRDARFPASARNLTGGSARYCDMEDVWVIKREYWTGDMKTPTKLPRAIIEKILAYTSNPGDLVLDPFLGSGQVAVVASLMRRSFVGFEIVPKYFDFLQERLRRGVYRLRGSGSRSDSQESSEPTRQRGLFRAIP